MGAHYTAGQFPVHKSRPPPCPVSAPRFFCPADLVSGQLLTLPPEVFAHAVRALRLDAGASVTLFNGRGGEFAATLATVGKSSAVAQVGEYSQVERESPLDIWLLQALVVGDKMDWLVQKAVELGVSAILPWQAERSVARLSGERVAKRQAHWEGVVISACEQCGRNRVPAVHAPLSLADAVKAAQGRTLVQLTPESSSTPLPVSQPLALVVGPEGGFTAAEASLLGTAGAIALNLGPRVLRTETAGAAAIAALQARFGDLAFPVQS